MNSKAKARAKVWLENLPNKIEGIYKHSNYPRLSEGEKTWIPNILKNALVVTKHDLKRERDLGRPPTLDENLDELCKEWSNKRNKLVRNPRSEAISKWSIHEALNHSYASMPNSTKPESGDRSLEVLIPEVEDVEYELQHIHSNSNFRKLSKEDQDELLGKIETKVENFVEEAKEHNSKVIQNMENLAH